ncbi:MAG: GNAT family N-acetyltransferase [Chloroflexi bacterium]|nr:GNAT family N-acetyltransferase [Chloroflexota bacterium]
MTSELMFHPLTPERWSDFETLFGEKGAYGGCWCTHWRIPRSQRNKYEGNRRAMEHMVRSEVVPGLLGYADGQAVAWCSVGPRTDYASLETSRLLKRVDDQPVWSIVCFFVTRSFRRQGIMRLAIRAAVEYALEHGAKIIEGYPIRVSEQMTAPGGYMGLASAFDAEGFVEIARVSETQTIVRYSIADA